jgi:CIC family chloride channel protein
MRNLVRDTSSTLLYILKWGIVASLVGFLGGISALFLRTGITQLTSIAQILPRWSGPIIGGLVVTVIGLWDKNALGFGTDKYISSVNNQFGYLPRKTLFSKLISTISTVGFGGSGGIEGPMLLIGGSSANFIERIPWLRKILSAQDRRILTICGASGALGAAFHSPLAGGIFAVEVLFKSSLHYKDLFPSLLSSTMGFVIYSLIDAPEPLLSIPEYIPDVKNIHWFILTAFSSGLFAIVFMQIFQFTRQLADRLPYPKLLPIFGGIITGVLVYLVPDVAGTGLGIIQKMIYQPFPLLPLVILIFVKIIATSATVGFGGSGGLVIPALFIGAGVGNFLGSLIQAPENGLLTSMVLTGMAASLASVANVPVSAALLLVELVGLRLAVPATVGSVLGYILGRRNVIYGRQYAIFDQDRAHEE